jgi:hypothetical protein
MTSLHHGVGTDEPLERVAEVEQPPDDVGGEVAAPEHEHLAQIYVLASPEPTTGSCAIPSPRGPQRPRHRTRHRGGCPSPGLHAGGRSDAATARGRGSAPRAEPPHRRRFPSGRGLRWCGHRPQRAGRAMKGGRRGGYVYERISGGGSLRLHVFFLSPWHCKK